MVSGLAERLKKDGSDLNGWLMLVRAYTVLGRKEDAVSALNDARGRFAGNNDALGQIDALAKSLGLPS
jgi:cytochrome c-type biogenesis protein CcmH